MVTFATANANGTLTERLGIGLQNRVRRFESARYLQRKIDPKGPIFFWRYSGGLWRNLFLVCFANARFPSADDLFLVCFANALIPFAWRPSGTAFSLQAFARPNTLAPAYDNVSPCVLLIRRKVSSCTHQHGSQLQFSKTISSRAKLARVWFYPAWKAGRVEWNVVE